MVGVRVSLGVESILIHEGLSAVADGECSGLEGGDRGKARRIASVTHVNR